MKLRCRLTSFFDRIDVVSMRSIRADSMLVHQRNQFRFRQHRRSRSRALFHFQYGRIELLTLLVRMNLFAGPFVVDVHLQVISLVDHQTRGRELFVDNLCVHNRLGAGGITAHTR